MSNVFLAPFCSTVFERQMSYCRPSNSLIPFSGFSGGSYFFEVILSSARDTTTYPSSANFTVPLARTYAAVRAIRLVNCTCAVPEVPAAQGIEIELPKTEPVVGQQFPIEPVPRIVWTPQQQGYCVDDGTFFPNIVNDGVTIMSEIVPSSSSPLPSGCGGPVETFVRPDPLLVYSQNNSRIFEDQNGVVYNLPERPPPVFAERSRTAPVLPKPPPLGVVCTTHQHMPHTVTPVQSVWMCQQYCWVTTSVPSGLLVNTKIRWITSDPFTSSSTWTVVSVPAVCSIVLVREHVSKVACPNILPAEQYLVAPRLQTLDAVANSWTLSFRTNFVVYCLISSPVQVTIFPQDVFTVSTTDGYPHRPTASTDLVSVPDWTQLTASVLDFPTKLQYCGSSPFVLNGSAWIPLELISVNPTTNCLGASSVLLSSRGTFYVECVTGSTPTVSSFAKNQPSAPLNVSFQNSSSTAIATVQSDLDPAPPTGTLAALIGSGQLSERIPPQSGSQTPTVFQYCARFAPLPSYVPDPSIVDKWVSMGLNLLQVPVSLVFRTTPTQKPVFIAPFPTDGVWTDDALSIAITSALTTGVLLTTSDTCRPTDPQEDQSIVVSTSIDIARVFRNHQNRWVISTSRPISILWSETKESQALAMYMGFVPTLNRYDQTLFVADYPTPPSCTQPGIELENRIVVNSSLPLFPNLTLSSVADSTVWTYLGCSDQNRSRWSVCVPTAISRGTMMTVVGSECEQLVLSRCDQLKWTSFRYDAAKCLYTLTGPEFTTVFETVGVAAALDPQQEIVMKQPRRPLNLSITSTSIYRSRGTFLGFSQNLYGQFQYVAESIPYAPITPTLLFLRLSPCPSITAWNSRNNSTSSTSSSSGLVPHLATLPVTLYGSVTAITHSEHNNGTVEFPTPQTISTISVQWVDDTGRVVDFQNQQVRMVLQFFCDANQDLPLL